MEKLKPTKSSDYNIFVSHGAVSGVKIFSMNEFNELIIPVKILAKNFDYVALGHYHKFTKLADNAYYSGSTEKFTFTDAIDKKGFIEFNLIDDRLKIKFISDFNSSLSIKLFIFI